jgi:CDP-diacylglycerol--serine O-phosphatidyltransferase
MFFKTKIAPHIPNLITLLNLVSGAIGLLLVFEGKVVWACFAIYIAAVFDFFDGFAARLLKTTSGMGKSLDSLADVISFGLLPSAIIFSIIQQIIVQTNPAFKLAEASFLEIALLASSLFVVAFSALRLANFNIDERQKDGFIGLPTPANAILISSFPFIIAQSGTVASDLLLQLYVIIPLTVVLSFLLVAEIPMMSFKFSNYKLSENIYRYLLVLIAVVCVLLWGVISVPIIFIFYILFSLLPKKAI